MFKFLIVELQKIFVPLYFGNGLVDGKIVIQYILYFVVVKILFDSNPNYSISFLHFTNVFFCTKLCPSKEFEWGGEKKQKVCLKIS